MRRVCARDIHTGLEALLSKKNGPMMGQVFLDSSDQCGRGRGGKT